MHVYSSVAVEVASHPLTKEVEFALLDMDPLSRALQENARCWVTSLGKFLNDSARESLTRLATKIEVCVCVCWRDITSTLKLQFLLRNCSFGIVIMHCRIECTVYLTR